MAEHATIRAAVCFALPKAAAWRSAVVLFFAAWQAIFLVVPFDPLFICKPSLIAAGYVDLIGSGDLLHDLAVCRCRSSLALWRPS